MWDKIFKLLLFRGGTRICGSFAKAQFSAYYHITNGAKMQVLFTEKAIKFFLYDRKQSSHGQKMMKYGLNQWKNRKQTRKKLTFLQKCDII